MKDTLRFKYSLLEMSSTKLVKHFFHYTSFAQLVLLYFDFFRRSTYCNIVTKAFIEICESALSVSVVCSPGKFITASLANRYVTAVTRY